MTTIREYLVTWTIELDAESPYEAAVLARAIQRDPSSLAGVFKCHDECGEETTIDLDDAEFSS